MDELLREYEVAEAKTVALAEAIDKVNEILDELKAKWSEANDRRMGIAEALLGELIDAKLG